MKTEHLLEAAEDGLITGNYKKSLEALNQILEEGENERASYLKGYLFYCMHNYEKAVPELESVTEKYPDNEEAHYYLSQIFAANGDYEAAKESIERALQCDPENTDYLGDYISIEQALKHYSHCIELCGTLLDEMPESNFALNVRGFSHMKLGDLDAAETDFRTCARENPMDFMCWNYLGLLLTEKGRFDEAEEAIKESIRNNPSFSDSYASWGYLFYKRGDGENALLALNKALETDPQNADAYKKRAEVYLLLNEHEKARADLLRADELGYGFFFDDQVEKLLASLNT